MRETMRIWTDEDMHTLARMAGEGKENKEIGEALGRSASAVNSQRRRCGLAVHRRRWQDDAEIMAAAGKSLREISRVCDVNYASVWAHFQSDAYKEYRRLRKKEIRAEAAGEDDDLGDLTRGQRACMAYTKDLMKHHPERLIGSYAEAAE